MSPIADLPPVFLLLLRSGLAVVEVLVLGGLLVWFLAAQKAVAADCDTEPPGLPAVRRASVVAAVAFVLLAAALGAHELMGGSIAPAGLAGPVIGMLAAVTALVGADRRRPGLPLFWFVLFAAAIALRHGAGGMALAADGAQVLGAGLAVGTMPYLTAITDRTVMLRTLGIGVIGAVIGTVGPVSALALTRGVDPAAWPIEPGTLGLITIALLWAAILGTAIAAGRLGSQIRDAGRAIRRGRRSAAEVQVRLAALIRLQCGLGVVAVMIAAALGPPVAPVPGVPTGSAMVATLADQFRLALGDLAQPAAPDAVAVQAAAGPSPAAGPDIAGQAALAGVVEWRRYTLRWAGLMVLMIGVFAYLEQTGQSAAARFWPFLLLFLIGFLINQSATDSWPLAGLANPAGLTDPVILWHRLALLLLAAAAAAEWGLRAGLMPPDRAIRWSGLALVGFAALFALEPAAGLAGTEPEGAVVEGGLVLLGLTVGWNRWVQGAVRPADPETATAGVAGRLWPLAVAVIGTTLLLYRPS